MLKNKFYGFSIDIRIQEKLLRAFMKLSRQFILYILIEKLLNSFFLERNSKILIQ